MDIEITYMFDPFLHRIQEPIYPEYLKGTTISAFNIRFTTVSDNAIQYIFIIHCGTRYNRISEKDN